MGFEIYFVTHRPDGGFVERPNPFKPGEMMRVASDAGMTSTERAAVIALLRSNDAIESPETGVYCCEFTDGGCAEVDASNLDDDVCTSISAGVWSYSPRVSALLFELMRSGNLVALPVMEGNVAVVPDEETRARVCGKWPDSVVVTSSEDFGRLLSGGYEVWRKYRDQVIGD